MREQHGEWPDLERYSNRPLFNTKAVVQQTGIAAPTLRAWERRYMILAPERAHNDYRLFSERDIATLRWLKGRVDTGMSISQAIALFRHLEEEQHRLSESPPSQSVRQQEQQRAGEETEGNHPALFEMRRVQERLLDAFSQLDEATANRLMTSMLAIYSIEQVCAELITPTLWEVGRRWEHGHITVAIEHFASAFFHSWLTNLLHAVLPNNTNPLVITCCAPGEEHELAALMLSLLLRRVGLRVAYLGQNIETEGLLQTTRQLSPALICISLTLISFLGAITELARKLQELPQPRPALVFGGQVFEQHADLIAQVPGVYLQGDMPSIIAQVKRMAFEQSE